jgi:threonine-phosphate decarboxylase
MPKIKQREEKYAHGGDIYRNDVVLDYSVNGNPLGPPASVISIFSDPVRCAKLMSSYPDPECALLRSALAAHDGLPIDSIICTNGAAEFICCLVKAVSPKKGLVLTPAFSEYERCLEAVNAECIFTDDESMFIQAVRTVDIAFLCNPVNPTGVLLEGSFIKKALYAAEENGTYLVVDESFLRFLEDFDMLTFRGYLKTHRRLVIIDSFTKIYAMPGLRLGFGLSSDEVLRERLLKLLPTWNVSAFSQEAGIKALGEEHYIDDTIAFLKEERQRLSGLLKDLGFKVTMGHADFIFFESNIDLYRPLLASGILIRDCGNYRGMKPGAYHYRIAVRKRTENDLLIRHIREAAGF